ncbi:MAG TPA: response regulator transcription factor [Candidatus Obscuribacterales bacterium]
MTRVLLAEDDEYLLSGLVLALERCGYGVDAVRSGTQADAALRINAYDLVLLDLGLPGVDGMDVLRNLRAGGETMPVIVITARDGLEEKIQGLDLGANDYLVKPFHFRELEARMRAALRKSRWQNKVEIEFGSLRLNTNSGSLTVSGEQLDLTPKEALVLKTLMAHAGRVVSKRQIMDQASEWADESSENAVEILIHRLRKKLDSAGVAINTIRGFGYVLEELK